jgi:hypothetical protein
MTSDPRRAKGGGWVVLVFGPVLLLVLYVGSYGPAARLQVNGWIPLSTWRTIYAPVLNASIKWRPVGRSLWRYRGLWVSDEEWIRSIPPSTQS